MVLASAPLDTDSSDSIICCNPKGNMALQKHHQYCSFDGYLKCLDFVSLDPFQCLFGVRISSKYTDRQASSTFHSVCAPLSPLPPPSPINSLFCSAASFLPSSLAPGHAVGITVCLCSSADICTSLTRAAVHDIYVVPCRAVAHRHWPRGGPYEPPILPHSSRWPILSSSRTITRCILAP